MKAPAPTELAPLGFEMSLETALTTNTEPFADTREMFLIHAGLEREFALLPGLVRGVAAGDTERSRIVADHIELLGEFLHHHHSAEDTHLWPKLLDRGREEVAPMVQVMESQHQSLHRLLGEVATATTAWRDNASSEQAQTLAGTLDRLLPQLDEHLRTEEERVLPLIEKFITAAEWAMMAADAPGGMSQEQLIVTFGMVMYEADPELVEAALSLLPEEARSVVREMAPRAFASYAERVHGTATPSRHDA